MFNWRNYELFIPQNIFFLCNSLLSCDQGMGNSPLTWEKTKCNWSIYINDWHGMMIPSKLSMDGLLLVFDFGIDRYYKSPYFIPHFHTNSILDFKIRDEVICWWFCYCPAAVPVLSPNTNDQTRILIFSMDYDEILGKKI